MFFSAFNNYASDPNHWNIKCCTQRSEGIKIQQIHFEIQLFKKYAIVLFFAVRFIITVISHEITFKIIK